MAITLGMANSSDTVLAKAMLLISFCCFECFGGHVFLLRNKSYTIRPHENLKRFAFLYQSLSIQFFCKVHTPSFYASSTFTCSIIALLQYRGMILRSFPLFVAGIDTYPCNKHFVLLLKQTLIITNVYHNAGKD